MSFQLQSGTAAYDGAVRFRVKSFAMEGELEFLVDGNPQAEGSAKIGQFNDPNSNSLYFTGGNKVDLVFYIRKKGTETYVRTQPEPKANPEIRINLPLDGTTVSFELPSLANPDEEYSVDICRDGTEGISYVRGAKALPLFPAIMANQGRYGSGIIFSKGSSKVLVIKDRNTFGTTPTPRHFIPIAKITDLSDYFQ